VPASGAVVPPWVEGVVAALGAGVADGSAAKATATPPTVSRPTASSAVATVRRAPPRVDRAGDSREAAAGGENDAGAANGDPAGGEWVGCPAG
jgi:hypothetical protein